MKQNYIMMFLLIVGVQLLICNYLHVSTFLTLSILPCAILLMPTRYSPVVAMLLAFVSGLAVDTLAEGVTGLNALALVPVAGARRWICGFIFGKELTSTGEDVSMMKYGTGKMAVAIFIAQFIFLMIYIWADGAESRPFMFNALRFSVSLVAGTLISLIIANLLDPNERK